MGFRHQRWLAERRFSQLQEQEFGALRYLVRYRALLDQATVPEDFVGDLRDHCDRMITRSDQWLATPQLDEIAKRTLADQTFDAVQEYADVRAALVGLRDAAVALNPRSTTERGGTPTSSRTYARAQVAAVIAALDALVAAHSK